MAGLHVRGDTGTFGELNTCAGYTPPRNNRVVYRYACIIIDEARYTPPRNNRVVYHHPSQRWQSAGVYTTQK